MTTESSQQIMIYVDELQEGDVIDARHFTRPEKEPLTVKRVRNESGTLVAIGSFSGGSLGFFSRQEMNAPLVITRYNIDDQPADVRIPSIITVNFLETGEAVEVTALENGAWRSRILRPGSVLQYPATAVLTPNVAP